MSIDPILGIYLAAIALTLLGAGALWWLRRREASGTRPRGRGLLAAMRRRLGRAPTVLDEEVRAALREVLIAADTGPRAADRILEELARRAPTGADEARLGELLVEIVAAEVEPLRGDLDAIPSDGVVVVVGVNGSGKTTTIAKLAHHWLATGRQVVLGAADTFRAAAADQLAVWAERLGVRLVRQAEGADPAAVAFDTVKAAEAAGAMAIVDTAGRIHEHKGLMDELAKIVRVVGKAREGAPHAVLLVLDASQGQAAIQQARRFAEAVPVTGLVVTKLDGEGKAGYLLQIGSELELPVLAIGTGEGLEDLEAFEPGGYARRIVLS